LQAGVTRQTFFDLLINSHLKRSIWAIPLNEPEFSSSELIGKRPTYVTTNRCPPINLRFCN